MDRLTWIIIVLILLSILVTCSEVFLRFGILTARSRRKGGLGGVDMGDLGMGNGMGVGVEELCGQVCRGLGVLS